MGELRRVFEAPPAEARPRVWWHWMNGNIDEAGIALDLEWMQRVGIGGVQVFEGGMNAPQLVSERLVFQSEGWRSAMRFAARKADELGLELTIATSAGWSAAGGPWVAERDAMKKLVWSEITARGGRTVDAQLPQLPDVSGLYQDVPGAPGADGPRHVGDTRTLAVPFGSGSSPLKPAEVITSSPVSEPDLLIDGAFWPGVVLPRDMEHGSTQWIAFRYDEPVTVRAVTVGLPGCRGFGSPRPVSATLEVSDDGVHYTALTDLPASSSPVRSRTFRPVTGRWFRLLLTGAPVAASVPPMAEGVLPLPFPPPAPETVVSELVLWADGRVSAAEEKAGFAAAPDYYAEPTPDDVAAIDPDAVVDVTAFVDDTGRLRWEAPEGEWRILRFGYSLTGQQNGPAPVEATGLEVDKLDAGRVERYLETWLRLYEGTVGPELMGERGIRSLLSDSIESGPQNWTDDLLGEFERRRGYSAVAWMPALAGYAVGSGTAVDRFLWDFRQTIAELYSDAFYGTVKRVAHKRGLTYYAEALEDHRPQLGDDMEMRSHADVPMGAMWTPEEGRGFKATYVADLRGASSVAHVYGKAYTGAESMSAFGHPYAYAPRDLKPVVDLELALGVTRFCIHTSPHQPSEVRAPGISLSPHLGQTFTRLETWAEQSRPWIDYLARSASVLNSGTPVVDIAYFYGEEAPLTALFGDEPPGDVPPGHAFDFVGADAVLTALDVDANGRLVSRGGVEYRLLYLGGTTRWMTIRVLRRLNELVDHGAVLVGERPFGSPSLADDPNEFARLADALWGSCSTGRPSRGRVHRTELSSALVAEDISPDWRASAPSLAFVHRTLDDGDVYFVSNAGNQPVSATISLRATATDVEWWDAVDGSRGPLEYHLDEGRTSVGLSLAAHGSGFVVLGAAPVEERRRWQRHELAQLVGPWSVGFPAASALPSRSLAALRPFDRDDGKVAVFSGTAAWWTELDVLSEWLDGGPLWLTLGDVRDLATVSINGLARPAVWTEPFETEVSGLLRPGRNLIEVAVTNTWSNRLIGDAAAPEQASTQTTGPVYRADATPPPWGLGGPVTLVRWTSDSAL